MIDKETALNKIDTGWHAIIDLIFAIPSAMPFCSAVDTLERHNGMLKVIFLRTELTNSVEDFILSSIEYKIERISAIRCEKCGAYGNRRKELPEVKSLCTVCYAHAYSAHNPAPSLVAYQEPHTDY